MSRGDGPGESTSDMVRLEFPGRADLLILARLVTAAVASRADLGVDDIDDLRLAVDELCLSVMGDEGVGTLALEVSAQPGTVEITCTFSGNGSSSLHQLAPPELSSRILEALVDEHEFESDDTRIRARLRKTATPAGGMVSPADPPPFA